MAELDFRFIIFFYLVFFTWASCDEVMEYVPVLGTGSSGVAI